MKRPILCCFDIDGTIAVHHRDDDGNKLFDGSTASNEQLLQMRAHPNVVRLIAQTMAMPHAEVMFCTGRSKSTYGVTWRWLNRHVSLADSGKRVSLVCRPDDTALEAIPQYKLSELVQAIRRQPQKLAELRCYDDSVSNLRLFQTLRPLVTKLRLFKCDDGVATAWVL